MSTLIDDLDKEKKIYIIIPIDRSIIHTSLFCTPPELKKVITASDIDKPIDDKTFSILSK
jgi:hypothetical protein